ncbi:MAG: HU family DNA-binding protein [Pseudomonadales bacterium]|uniref:DNA-binding protein HU-beta n=2 Tax=Oleiphilus messinensis TaxID=141451 RepID=A0A1Y0I1U8_9GAMM|nr:DNA-binding protein HU-beta [Oleiphilus messinensis]MCG8611531.1 HU family DNA-binding protein [Pseudomonadales bacterium]
MNKPELASLIATQSQLSKAKASEVITVVTDEITNALASGASVSLLGFGSFNVTQRKARSGRNPQTGQTMTIAASQGVHFKPGKSLREAVNES